MKPNNREIYYVGIGNNIKRAYHTGCRNNHWNNVYNKYGLLVDIVAQNISIEEAKEMEKFLIASYGVENLTNISLGGEGGFGVKYTQERKDKVSLRFKGRASPMKGKKHSEERNLQVSKRHKGKIVSEETRTRISESKKGIATRTKGCIVLNTQIGIFYDSIKEAAIYHNISPSALRKQLIGKNKNKTNLILA